MRRWRLWACLLGMIPLTLACRATSPIAPVPPLRSVQIDADFPGGNIIVEKVAGDQCLLRPDLRDTSQWWFYWCFRVRGGAGRTLTFAFTDGNPIGVRGPAISTDGGKNWDWLGTDSVDGASFRYAFPTGVDDVRFSFTIPYLESNLRDFLQSHTRDRSLRVGTLCLSRKGRPVELLYLGRLDGRVSSRVLLTARHHACESMASFVIEGFIHGVLTDTDLAWLRDEVEFLIVPFVDKDGVEDGDQGKLRAPRDHNRDYEGESIYPEVRALRGLSPEWSQGRLRVAFDVHCPHIRGSRNEMVYFVGLPSDALWRRLGEFSDILESLPPRGLPYHTRQNLPFGQEWNNAKMRGEGKSMAAWAGEIPGVEVASTLEVPYANASGTAVTPTSARAFGGDLARAIQLYLRNSQ